MPCFHPIPATYVFKNAAKRPVPMPKQVPCGKCRGCRAEHARQWRLRMIHEASMHEHNTFITLTYSPENLPLTGSLRPVDFTHFMKRLRRDQRERELPRFNYFQCGEYGEHTSRPHHHAILFGYRFDDAYPWVRRGKHQTHRSDLLDERWGLGHAEIGTFSAATAGYVARYVTKKVGGSLADAHYERLDRETGELIQLKPEYATMSRNPAIALSWFNKYWTDVYPSDFVVIEGKKQKPPLYYDRLLEKRYPPLFEQIKAERRANANTEDNTRSRLASRETCLIARESHLTREPAA